MNQSLMHIFNNFYFTLNQLSILVVLYTLYYNKQNIITHKIVIFNLIVIFKSIIYEMNIIFIITSLSQ